MFLSFICSINTDKKNQAHEYAPMMVSFYFKDNKKLYLQEAVLLSYSFECKQQLTKPIPINPLKDFARVKLTWPVLLAYGLEALRHLLDGAYMQLSTHDWFRFPQNEMLNFDLIIPRLDQFFSRKICYLFVIQPFLISFILFDSFELHKPCIYRHPSRMVIHDLHKVPRPTFQNWIQWPTDTRLDMGKIVYWLRTPPFFQSRLTMRFSNSTYLAYDRWIFRWYFHTIINSFGDNYFYSFLFDVSKLFMPLFEWSHTVVFKKLPLYIRFILNSV